MSRALALGVSRASLFATIVWPTIDPATAAAARRAVRGVVQVGGMVLGSVAAAAMAWVMLAGPGFVSGAASTAVAGHGKPGYAKAGPVKARHVRMAAR